MYNVYWREMFEKVKPDVINEQFGWTWRRSIAFEIKGFKGASDNLLCIKVFKLKVNVFRN